MDSDDLNDELKSKSQVKREMKKIQEIGEELLVLPESYLHKLNLPEHITQAIFEASKTSKFGAKKRHLKYISSLLREIDVEPIRISLDKISRGTLNLKKEIDSDLDILITKLLDNDKKALGELISSHVNLDRQQLNQLVRNAQKEKKTGNKRKNKDKLSRFLSNNLNI